MATNPDPLLELAERAAAELDGASREQRQAAHELVRRVNADERVAARLGRLVAADVAYCRDKADLLKATTISISKPFVWIH